ncbi:hypothetical protein [Deinococcus aestuarii]|uniref:hypothetical protein n=1 Tax=Deinococcus aestuarii TaxID=2774531 RepID=UPI001C0B7777|nr:hypothetical protein [Deinococcus aestuarii]
MTSLSFLMLTQEIANSPQGYGDFKPVVLRQEGGIDWLWQMVTLLVELRSTNLAP